MGVTRNLKSRGSPESVSAGSMTIQLRMLEENWGLVRVIQMQQDEEAEVSNPVVR
jgi:hypothetical protein